MSHLNDNYAFLLPEI